MHIEYRILNLLYFKCMNYGAEICYVIHEAIINRLCSIHSYFKMENRMVVFKKLNKRPMIYKLKMLNLTLDLFFMKCQLNHF